MYSLFKYNYRFLFIISVVPNSGVQLSKSKFSGLQKKNYNLYLLNMYLNLCCIKKTYHVNIDGLTPLLSRIPLLV